MANGNGNGNGSIGSKVAQGLKTGGVAGAVIAAIASLGYAEIQREENDILLQNNTFLVEMVQREAIACREQIVKAYTRGVDAEVKRADEASNDIVPKKVKDFFKEKEELKNVSRE